MGMVVGDYLFDIQLSPSFYNFVLLSNVDAVSVMLLLQVMRLLRATLKERSIVQKLRLRMQN